MEKTIVGVYGQGKSGILARFFRSLKNKVSELFEPEEVEVTFRHHGNKTSYTYTKVSHKQVA